MTDLFSEQVWHGEFVSMRKNNSMMQEFDYIIVGQGIAGTMLGWFLMKEKKSFVIIDAFNPTSSSHVAAGIIHPVTGRRIVKTWMADALSPFAAKTYNEIENVYHEKFFHPVPVLELLSTIKEQNDWQQRSEEEGMKQYINTNIESDLYSGELKTTFSKVEIQQTGWLNISKMLLHFRKYFEEQKNIINEAFDFAALALSEENVTYKNITAEKIIFCEGAAAMQNPFWKHLPFLPSKGEVLTIEAPQLNIRHIITKTIFILPHANNLFRVGSTYDWNDLNETPTEKAKEKILEQLNKIISVDYKVIEHKAAVRPTVKNRRPFIGLHHEHKQIGLFNGLGTKGVLIAPFFAHHFSEFLVHKKELMKEVNVSFIS
jgi:glycine oxidase